ncbi:unnamed protein product [Diplocarpon coronariae]
MGARSGAKGYPASNFKNAATLLKKFHSDYPNALRPLARL